MTTPHAASPFVTIDHVRRRAASAAVSWSALASEPLRAHLLETLAERGGRHSFMADPVVEVTSTWGAARETLSSLSGRLLQPELVSALEGAGVPDPEGRKRYRFKGDQRPFTHQLEAWERLLDDDPQSVLVTSGTGSGKTECFLVPILNRLARASAQGLPRLSGVRALVIYPLNALINSQRERLSDWTSPFKGKIRFCLYNGETPDKLRLSERNARPEEIRDRETLRNEPPQILVTNITMLEYMLIRSKDRPILDASQGKLEFIVLDEAHTYVGSQAAELALLLRRVTQAFGVDPGKVRFVATSATIGGEGDAGTRGALRRFLADIGGVPESRVHVIEGSRVVPPLPEPQPGLELPTPSELAEMDGQARYGRLAACPQFRKAYDALRPRPASVSEWAERLGVGTDACERLLEAAAGARADVDVAGRRETHALLPLRIHAFHRTEPGIFVCINPSCRGRAGTKLDHAAWRYGAVFHERIERCPDCQSLILELKLCSNCGNETLTGERITNHDAAEEVRLPSVSAVDDEFEQGLVDDEQQPPDGGQEDANETDEVEDDDGPAKASVLLTASGHGKPCAIHRTTGKVMGTMGAEAVLLQAADEVICPSCSATLAGRGNARLYSFRLGAPFLLGNIIPELLEDASESDTIRQGSAPRFRPADGKQLLTFTDSRQGTARLSAKLQAEAERNYVRAFIYHAVQNAAGGGGNADELERLDRDIAEIKAQLEQAPILKRLLDQKLAERERLTRPQGIAWSKMVDALSSDRTVRYIREKIWLDRDNRQFHGDPQFAKFLLLRELFRRPRRANSVETLGLACLTAPAIETQTEIGVPRELKDHGGTLDDWKAFLAVALTWYVRANSIVMVPRELKRFIHRRIPTRCLIGPQAERKDAILQRQWPRQVSQDWRLPAFVRLLMQGLKLNLADPGHRADAEAILLKAWNALYPGLQSGNDGYQLAYDKLNLMALESAWLCPVTNRVLDRSFRRLTPYPAIAGSSSDAEFRTVTPIELPRLPFPFGQAGGREATPDEIEAWLRDDARVVAGRARGTWGDLHDAVARRGNFFRAAEHSAQQPGWRLREYEKEFRQGLINVLNCSTTMEMGVDIGSIGTVAMTNVPESLASYRQRIGRAGRSGQAMSLGFTLCKDRPLDAAVFRQPIKMLERAMHAPAVRLDSPVIVQRHVNALLLGAFLHGRGEELHQLKAGPFFGCERAKGTEPGDACASRLLVDWVARPATRKAMELPLNALLARTCLEGRLDRVVEEARAAMSAGETLFRQVWAPLNLNLSELEQTARKAIELQQGRLERTFVLAELAAHGFLPAYGFPTDVVEFDNSGPWTPAHPRRGGGEIEPGAQPEGGSTRFAPRSMPSRSLDLAIRDYAPGTEVVLDGLVYRSAGVSLAWRRPASAEGLEHIEALGWMWRCQVCGAVGTAVLKPDHCPSCNTEQPPQATKTLKPAGFSCDPSDPPHDEVEQIDYIPPRSPLVSASTGAWVALHDAAVGRFRKSSSGQVIYHTMGAHGCGYAVCLQCGRAAPESSEDPSSPPPQGMVPHRALRTWKKGADGRCDGADRTYSIQRHRALAHEITTDVFELQLFDLPAEEEGRGLALPIGFAVREALARWWGIETAEVGVSVAQSRRDDGAKTWSIILYDRASGGAGFAPTAAEAIDVLLKDAADILDCRNGYSCRSGCPDCILTRDAEVYSAGIDRPVALDLLRTKVLPRLHVPEADRRLGNGATVELEPLEDVITALASRSAKAALTIWLPGNIWELDIARWPAVPLARRLALHGVGVRFVLTGTDVPADQDKRMRLLSLLQTTGAELASARPLGIASGFRPLAHLSSGPGMLWAVRDTGDGAGDLENPWRPGANVLRCASSAPDASPIALSALALRSDPSLVQVDISSEIDGALNGFGERFWTQIHGKTPLIADLARAEPLQTIGYTDRYLKSPLVVRLIYEILKAAPGLSRSTTTLRLSTAGNTRGLNGSYPSKLFHDWAREADRQSVVRSLMGQVAETSSVVFGQRGDLSHARVLSLAYAKSTVRIYLDQGVGFWRMNASELFDFTRDAAIQAQKLMQATTPVSGDGNKPMPVWLRRN